MMSNPNVNMWCLSLKNPEKQSTIQGRPMVKNSQSTIQNLWMVGRWILEKNIQVFKISL